MKNQLLTFAIILAANAALAQEPSFPNTSGKRLHTKNIVRIQAGPESSIAQATAPGTFGGTAKATAGGARWYSYADYINRITPLDDSLHLPFLWQKAEAKAIYKNKSGLLSADTIRLASIGMSFDPTFSISRSGITKGFYDRTLGYPGSGILVTPLDAYSIDTVMIWGLYGRNNKKTSIVDTLRFALVYGNGSSTSDLPISYFGGTRSDFPFTAFGFDTVRFATLGYDKGTGTVSGTSRVIKDAYLKNTDTSLANFRSFFVPVGMNIPVGHIVGISVSFLSGDPDFRPNVDTVFMGDLRPDEPYEFGAVQPLMLSEPMAPFSKSAPGYPQYIPGYYNTGYVKLLPDFSGFADYYKPSYAFDADFSYEMPQMDIKVSCASCKTLGGIGTAPVVNSLHAFPNPSGTEVHIPFVTDKTTNVTISLSNMLGQTLAMQQLTTNAGQPTTVTFQTSDWSPGIYCYTLEAEGQRVTERFTVLH